MNPTTTLCPACGEPTFRRDLTPTTDEAAAILGVHPDREVCRWCAARAEREFDDAEETQALASDPDFATVCDLRRARWIAAVESETTETTVTCTGCGREVPWYAVDTTGRCDACPAAAQVAA